MTDFITVTAGSPQVDVAPGTYVMTLLDISEPRTIFPQTGPNAGKEVQLRDWTFALEDGTEIPGSASVASGPKSKTYAWLTALLGGQAPQVGASYPKQQLVGRMVLGTITIDEGGWPKIVNLSAVPASMLAQQVGQVTGAPVAAAAPVQQAPAPPPAPAGKAKALPF